MTADPKLVKNAQVLKEVSKFIAADEKKHREALIDEYLSSIYTNSNISNEKATYIEWAFRFLVASIGLIGVAVILTLAFPISSDASGTYLCKLVEEGGREMTCRIVQ